MTAQFWPGSKSILRRVGNVEPAGFPVSQETLGEDGGNLGDGIRPVGFEHRIPRRATVPLIADEISLQEDVPESAPRCRPVFAEVAVEPLILSPQNDNVLFEQSRNVLLTA